MMPGGRMMSMYAGFAPDYERLFPFREEVFRYLACHAGVSGARVLDVGCGSGHYCGRFADEGFSAIGIDMDEAMIAEARRRYSHARFLLLDMRQIESAGSGFRCIYSIGNVMAHITPDELGRMVGRIFSMLEPGGSWIMQVLNWDGFSGMRAYDFPSKTIERSGGVTIFRRHYDFPGPDSVIFTVSLEQAGGVVFEERTMLYPLSVNGYLRLHESAGFRNTGRFCDYAGGPVRSEPGAGLVLEFRKP